MTYYFGICVGPCARLNLICTFLKINAAFVTLKSLRCHDCVELQPVVLCFNPLEGAKLHVQPSRLVCSIISRLIAALTLIFLRSSSTVYIGVKNNCVYLETHFSSTSVTINMVYLWHSSYLILICLFWNCIKWSWYFNNFSANISSIFCPALARAAVRAEWLVFDS